MKYVFQKPYWAPKFIRKVHLYMDKTKKHEGEKIIT